MDKIYLAGGCFWGVEKYFKQINGVTKTLVGYANGNCDSTSYKELKDTNHAEVVYLEYDEKIVSLAFLLDMYYKVIDPISVNKQGEDEGVQYRTGIYYVNDNQLHTIEDSIEELEKKLDATVAIEIEPIKNFITAEEYHQDYLDKNPTGYCHIPNSKFEMAKNSNR